MEEIKDIWDYFFRFIIIIIILMLVYIISWHTELKIWYCY